MRAPAMLAGGVLAFAVATSPAHAQTAGVGQGLPPEDDGSLPLGPFRITPRFRLGSLGLDTNVFYTAEDRRTDFVASGGPGVDVALPFAARGRAYVGGDLDYTFFLRTASQRHFGGMARAGLEWRATRFEARAEPSFVRSYGRPSLEVDERIVRDEGAMRAELLLRTPARLAFRSALELLRYDVPEGSSFRGAPLDVTLTRDTDRILLGLEYALTPKTSALLEGDDQTDRFPLDPSRDADSNRIYAGLRIESLTRLSGRAVAGIRSFRPRDPQRGGDRTPFYASARLAYAIGPRTRLEAGFEHDLDYSAFLGPGPQTLSNELLEARLEKGLAGRFELWLWVRRLAFQSDGPLAIESDGEVELVERDDVGWEFGSDLGYLFASRLRAGVALVYARRRSNVSDLGIEGLLLGGTLMFNPRR
jgi:hypothetical protein